MIAVERRLRQLLCSEGLRVDVIPAKGHSFRCRQAAVDLEFPVLYQTVPNEQNLSAMLQIGLQAFQLLLVQDRSAREDHRVKAGETAVPDHLKIDLAFQQDHGQSDIVVHAFRQPDADRRRADAAVAIGLDALQIAVRIADIFVGLHVHFAGIKQMIPNRASGAIDRHCCSLVFQRLFALKAAELPPFKMELPRHSKVELAGAAKEGRVEWHFIIAAPDRRQILDLIVRLIWVVLRRHDIRAAGVEKDRRVRMPFVQDLARFFHKINVLALIIGGCIRIQLRVKPKRAHSAPAFITIARLALKAYVEEQAVQLFEAGADLLQDGVKMRAIAAVVQTHVRPAQLRL